MLAWKRGIAILTAGQVKVTPDHRVRLVNGHTLQIKDAVPSDGGDYICQIATFEPREITHHVEILSKHNTNLYCNASHTCCFHTHLFIHITRSFSPSISFNHDFFPHASECV
jgi:hypothetical protein